MKIGILGDIHANLAALKAVLKELDAEGVDKIFSTGDVVGYGPFPEACIEILQEREVSTVMGNHDDYVTSFDNKRQRIHEDARMAIAWTQRVLPKECKEWLMSLPRMIEWEGIQFVHSSHVLKPKWRYVVNPLVAVENFMMQTSHLSFNGHTHIPILATHNHGCPARVNYLKSCRLPGPDCLKLVGVGSVGQPRDGDPRAATVVYDTKTFDLKLIRAQYDYKSTQKAILEVGLPPSLAERLELGR